MRTGGTKARERKIQCGLSHWMVMHAILGANAAAVHALWLCAFKASWKLHPHCRFTSNFRLRQGRARVGAARNAGPHQRNCAVSVTSSGTRVLQIVKMIPIAAPKKNKNTQDRRYRRPSNARLCQTRAQGTLNSVNALTIRALTLRVHWTHRAIKSQTISSIIWQ